MLENLAKKREEMMMEKRVIYAVWGPTAEWADGIGPLGYAASEEEAEEVVAEYIADCTEYGPRSHYGSGGARRDDYVVFPLVADELLAALGLSAEEFADVEELVDRLNAML